MTGGEGLTSIRVTHADRCDDYLSAAGAYFRMEPNGRLIVFSGNREGMGDYRPGDWLTVTLERHPNVSPALASPPAGEDLRERVARLSAIKSDHGYGVAVLQVYGSRPRGEFYDDLAAILSALPAPEQSGGDERVASPTTAPELEVDLFLAVTEDANLPADVNVADLDLKAVAERLVGLGWGRP